MCIISANGNERHGAYVGPCVFWYAGNSKSFCVRFVLRMHDVAQPLRPNLRMRLSGIASWCARMERTRWRRNSGCHE